MFSIIKRFLAAAGMAGMACLIAYGPRSALGQGPAGKLPEGAGLAARYPGDSGIDKHPDVVFVEDFERASLDDMTKRWDAVGNPEVMSLSGERPHSSGGRSSLLVRHVGGAGNGGSLYRRLPPGHDRLFVRFYVKFDRECAPIHHFFHVGGYNPATPYAQGGAGIRPRGDERFSVGIEPSGEAWEWDYYAYWMEMDGSPPRGQAWGNNFLSAPKPKVLRDSWICVEAMIRMNEVGDSDGEMALWIDGRRVSHLGKGFPAGKWVFGKFLPGEGGESLRWGDPAKGPERSTVPAGGRPFGGFRWRKDEDLKLNFLWLLVYITRAPEGHVSKVWFDDIVVAGRYIGPLAGPRE